MKNIDMLNIYLLRHGETQWNADGNKYCGRTDVPLTQKGINQAKLVSEQLSEIIFDQVYSSPLQRAYQTAQIVSNQNNIISDNRLIEADFGKWEGKTKEQFILENKNLWKDWENDPVSTQAGENGETAWDVIIRVEDFFSSLLDKHDQGNLLVVAHNGVNRFYLAHKLGMNIKDYRMILQENSSITLFSLSKNGDFTLKLLNSRGV